MFRYLGLAWDLLHPQQSDAVHLLSQRLRTSSTQWREVFDSNGLRIFCADIRPGSLEPRVLAANSGVVLGMLFERSIDVTDDSPSSKATLSAPQSKEILDSRGRWLVDRCWGNYVAFLNDPATTRKWVIKDPTGNLPCFSTAFRGVTVFFSSVTDCAVLQLPQFTINRAYLKARILSNSGGLERNALNEVDQVHRGECVEIDPTAHPATVSRRFYWNPLSFAESDDAIEDSEHAARAIRATVRSCTSSWASCHDSLLHRLSGGLDSSIVVGCLKDAPTHPRVVCYTYYNPKGRSDARPWARLAAQHAECEHLEYSISPADISTAAMLHMEPSVEPVAAMAYQQRATVEKQLAADRAATAVFNGDGGDSGFCSDSLAYALPEYFRRHGIRREAFRLASQVALSTERSTLSVFARSIRRWLRGSRMTDQHIALLMSCRLVSPDVRDTFTADAHYPHPWFSHMNRVPWATIRRLGMLVCGPEFYSVCDPDGPAPEVISPLYSQPAIELFLRIPIYRHFEGGRDRGLARRAFGQEVPEPILRRLWKDRAPGFYDELISRNREFLREAFLDGVLVAEGLLDRTAIEAALSATPMKSAVLPGEIFKHLDVELWARRWMRSSQHRAVA